MATLRSTVGLHFMATTFFTGSGFCQNLDFELFQPGEVPFRVLEEVRADIARSDKCVKTRGECATVAPLSELVESKLLLAS